MTAAETFSSEPGIDTILQHIQGRASQVSSARLAPVVLIEGPSGAGKSTLAGSLAPALAAVWSRPDVTVLHMEDMYGGWNSLIEGTQLLEALLAERAQGRPARWQRFDWRSSTRAEWHECNPAVPLLVEGCGSLTAVTAQLAAASVWVNAPAEIRRERALSRGGEDYDAHWQVWDDQFTKFVNEHQPQRLATLKVDSSG